MTPSTDHALRAVVFVVLGAFGAWAVVCWLWPWCGPWLVTPCPVATRLGCLAATVVGAVWGLARAVVLEVAERRRLSLPRARRISQPIPWPPSRRSDR